MLESRAVTLLKITKSMDVNTLSCNKIFISKLKVKEIFLYIKLLWEENEDILFHINIFDENNTSWSGSFSNDIAENCRSTFENEDKEEYKRSVKLALTGCSNLFVYDFVTDKINPSIKIFKWKKVFEDSAIVVHGSVPVNQVTESKNNIIDFLLEENKYLRKSIEDCNVKNVELNNDLEKCKRELESFVTMKTSLEETLYGKFIQLLNEKKNRIQLLEETIEKL